MPSVFTAIAESAAYEAPEIERRARRATCLRMLAFMFASGDGLVMPIEGYARHRRRGDTACCGQ
jgi:hypothetical protein